jgi:hypothetical protein
MPRRTPRDALHTTAPDAPIALEGTPIAPLALKAPIALKAPWHPGYTLAISTGAPRETCSASAALPPFTANSR